MKEKIASEKNNYEREEMRERFTGLDSLFRVEMQRKDEQIKTLQSVYEN
jgi:hypothetical protein